MKRKTLLICTTAVISQMCFFTGCSDDKSKDTSENELTVSESETSVISQDSSEISSDIKSETANSDTITSTDKEFILPEIEIEDDTSEMSQNVSAQSDKADKSNNDNKAVTTKSETIRHETVTTKVTAKITTPAVMEKSNTPAQETTAKPVDSDVSAGTITTETIIDVIELPEIEFD